MIAETAAWLDLLYSGCTADDGQLVVVHSSKRYPVAIHTVGTGKDLVEAATDMHNHVGCYLKINLMDWEMMEERRRIEQKAAVVGGINEVKTIVSIQLDVDAGKSSRYVSRRHALHALDRMPFPPSLIINSNGDNGGFHAYWVLEKPYRIPSVAKRKQLQKVAAAWNDKLKELCNGKLDSTSNLDRVLRVVGVPRTDGGKVCLHSYDPSRLYDLNDFRKAVT